MKSKLAMAAATIALSGLIPGSSRGAETSDSTNVNEPFLGQMEQSHAFETKGLAAVIHEEQSTASSQQTTQPFHQPQMTTQTQNLWISTKWPPRGRICGNQARQKLMAPLYGQCKKRASGRLTRRGATPCATM